MVAHAFNASTQDAKAGISLSSRTSRATKSRQKQNKIKQQQQKSEDSTDILAAGTLF